MASQRYISDTLKQKKNKVKKIKIIIFIVCIALLAYGLITLTRLEKFQITTTTLIGNSFVSNEYIQDRVDQILDSSYLYVIPKSNIFLFPKGELISKLRENPALVDISVNKDFFNTLTIDIVEQEKEAIYCTSVENQECYFLNGDGYIYSNIPIPATLENEIVMYREGEQRAVKEFFTESELYNTMMAFIKSSARQGITIKSVFLKSDGVIEFMTESQTRIITSRYDDFEKGFSNLIALFDKEILRIEDISSIEYFDLRFGNKVYYKNKTTDILEE